MANSWEQLLGGYATDTLTEEEKRQLFEAALQDQELFNALADEEALKALLTKPEARLRILARLEESVQSQGLPSSKPKSQWKSWMKNAPPLAWGGSIAALGLALIFGWQMEKEWGPEVRQAEKQERLTSDKTEERVVRLAERVIQLEEERAKLALKTKEEEILRARQKERFQEKARAFKSTPALSSPGSPTGSPSAGSSDLSVPSTPSSPNSRIAPAVSAVPQKSAPTVIPNEVGQMEKKSSGNPKEDKIQQFATMPQTVQSTEPQTPLEMDLTEPSSSEAQRDEAANVEGQNNQGQEDEILSLEGQGRETPDTELPENEGLNDEVQKNGGLPVEALKTEVPEETVFGEEFSDDEILALASPTGEKRQDEDLDQQTEESFPPGDELQQSEGGSSSETKVVSVAREKEQPDEVAQTSMSELDDRPLDGLLSTLEEEEKKEVSDVTKGPSIEDEYSQAQTRGIRYYFVRDNSEQKREAVNLKEFDGNWKNLRLVIESNVTGHLYVLNSYAEGKWQWVKPLFVTKPGVPGGGISLEPFKPLEFSISQLTNVMGKPLVSSIRVALNAEPLQTLDEAFGTRKIEGYQKHPILEGKDHRKYVMDKGEKAEELLIFEVELED